MNAEYLHLLGKTRDAHRGGYDAWAVQSTGERVAVALVLNKPEWLAKMDYTIAEAIERSGAEWVSYMRQIERQIRDEADDLREAGQ